MAYCTSPTRAATVRDLDDFQNNQHTFSRLQLLPSFTGSPITRFDSWLESFESIVDGSGWSEEKTIQMLRAKLTDRAFSVIQAILKEHPHDYESIKEALLDHFHGDENVDLYLQKFNKAKRKPGEKVVDYALRIQEIFKRAYPVGHSEKSFAVILMQKFIEGLDSKLQTKVKYKEFKDFNELVAATRVYALRLEALETDREKQEFIRSIDGSQDTSSAEQIVAVINVKD
ncbi:paraneoplastic antigen-like protein 5 [Daphnia magna]|uniref:paraneoplastic antigen-like protein 5 n=1 Tax=Daphnia magna TaxID=35525 RepID=UPI001E1BDE03|nr:paraneoplastic antigen-like protein 5 [Daphnia magna]